MTKEECFYLGKITKLHSFKGELEIFLDVDQPEVYRELDMFYVEMNPKQSMLVPHFIEELQQKRDKHFRVRIEDIDSEEMAMTLVNKAIYLPLEELPELGENQFYYHEIIDFKVVDEDHGEVGIVSSVADQGANHMLVVERDEKEILIPINDAFFRGIDKTKKEIYISTPEGFFELFS
ncbi:ribosome maturation factor RimM [Halocola ammonii]